MSNKQLFKEAIAEAKSIREAAIINAKEALEETLTPQIKSLLAQRLAEMEEEEEAPKLKEEGAEDVKPSEVVAEAEDEEEKGEEEEAPEAEEKKEDEDEELEIEDMSIDDLKDLIGDIVSQMMDQEAPIEEPAGEEAPMDMVGMEDEEEIDLDEILAELSADTPGFDDFMNAVDDVLGVGHPQHELLASAVEKALNNGEIHPDPNDPSSYVKQVEMIAAKLGINETSGEVQAEVAKLQKELNEAVATISKLKANLSEVNVLNAKLLYINKLFKSNRSLTESQIANIIATFDNASTAKEAQLVYESLKTVVNTKPAKSTVVETKLGMASKPAGVAPKKAEIITEVSDAVKRMQKLAGIIK